MRKIWAYIKKWWWLGLSGISFVIAAVFVFGKKERLSKGDLLEGKSPQSIPDSFRQVSVIEAEKAQTDILIEKAKSEAKTETKKEELKRIKEIQNPIKRRQELSSWAERNI